MGLPDDEDNFYFKERFSKLKAEFEGAVEGEYEIECFDCGEFDEGEFMNNQDIRWQQRFNNFQRAFLLLREAMDNDLDSLSQLEKEGIIQRFEYTFELVWKVIKDKMEDDGVMLDKISPKAVIRKAYAAKYIQDAETWLKNDR